VEMYGAKFELKRMSAVDLYNLYNMDKRGLRKSKTTCNVQ